MNRTPPLIANLKMVGTSALHGILFFNATMTIARYTKHFFSTPQPSAWTPILLFVLSICYVVGKDRYHVSCPRWFLVAICAITIKETDRTLFLAVCGSVIELLFMLCLGSWN